ncbi:MAG: hypothetical protein R3C09_14765 [Pirellulaceae bacterium]
MARYDDLSTGPIAYAAFVSTVILLVVILLVRALCYSWVESEDAKRLVDARYVASDAEIARQKSEIANYAKVQVPAAVPEGAEARCGCRAENGRSPAHPRVGRERFANKGLECGRGEQRIVVPPTHPKRLDHENLARQFVAAPSSSVWLCQPC